MEQKSSKRSDQIKGLLIGTAFGDSLGSYVEFRFQKATYDGTLQSAQYWNRSMGKITNSRYTQKGQFTDDTEMMLILARRLAQDGKYDQNAVVLDYLCWANHPTTWAMGRNTRKLFKGIKTLKGFQNRHKKMLTERSDNQSNGGLMRSAVLALLPEKASLQDVEITNPHLVCRESNRLYLQTIRKVLQGETKSQIVSDLITETKNLPTEIKPLKQCCLEAFSSKIRDVKSVGKGWVLHAMWCWIYCFVHFNSYKKAIDFVINLGGDTDTNAAITGALLGCFYGFDRIYQENTEQINILLNCSTKEGSYPRPQQYTLHDVNELTEKLSVKFP